jgi:hypothetical protein
MLSKKYSKLLSTRNSYERRAEECARFTIPSAFSRESQDPAQDYELPWQSLGADGLTSLSAKLKQVLFPSNVPFFRLSLSQEELKSVSESFEEAAQGDPQVYQAALQQFRDFADSGMSLYEQEAVRVMESRGDGPKQYQVFLQLLVAGNCLIKDTRVSREFAVCRLNSYVTKRDDTGKILEVILKEDLSRESLLEVPGIDEEALGGYITTEDNKEAKNFCFYTGAILKDGKYKVTQEVQGAETSEPLVVSEADFDEDDLPIRPLRLYTVAGEHYSRSYVDQFLGDLKTLDGLYKAVSEGTAAATRFIWCVNPNSTISVEDLNAAQNGDAITGNPEDVRPLSADGKIRDLASAYQLIERLEQRLGKVFLLHSAVQRNAERVTATEVARMIQELETQLGGIYSLLSQEFQRPYVWFLLDNIKALPRLPKNIVDTAIITGQDALGRTEEVSRLDEFLARVGQSIPNGLMYLKPKPAIERYARNLGVTDFQALLKSDEELQQEQEAAREQELERTQVEKGTAPAIQALANQQ